MRLSNEWFTALSEDEDGHLVTVSGRDELTEFIQSGKFKERVEITWKYHSMLCPCIEASLPVLLPNGIAK